MPRVKAGDISMYYEVHGKGEPLVLIAGFTCNGLVWQEMIEPLAKRFQVLVFDNRGCGRTDTPEKSYSIERMARDTAALLEGLGWKRAHFVGHSMGTAIVQQICLDFPQMIEKGMLCSAFAKLPEKSVAYCDAMNALAKAGVGVELIFKSAFPWICSDALFRDKQGLAKMMQKRAQDPFPQTLTGRFCQTEALRTFDSRERLREIQTPLMVVVGDEDILTPPSCAEFLAKNLPHAKLFVFKGQAHSINMEKPKELSELILSYFSAT